jgi:hypothetical protein
VSDNRLVILGRSLHGSMKAMSRRKDKRKSFIDKLFGGSLFDEMDDVLERFGREDMSSGYSISVKQTPEGTKVYAKVGKETNVNELGRQLLQQ